MREKMMNWLFLAIRIVSDVLLILASFLMAYLTRFGFTVSNLPPINAYIRTLSLVVLIWLLIFTLLGLYRFRKGLFIEIDEFFIVLFGTFIASFALSYMTFIYREFFYSRLFLSYAWGYSFIFISSAHYIVRRTEASLKSRGIGSRRTLIVGTGEMGRVIAERILGRPHLGYNLIGFLKGDSEKEELKDLKNKYPIFGEIQQIKKVSAEKKIESIFITVPYFSRDKLIEIASFCDEKRISLRAVPHLFEVLITSVGVDDLDGVPLVGLKESRFNAFNNLLKRLVDIVLSLFGLAVTSPVLMLFVIPGIRLSSKGPILYRQKRIGVDGKRFTLYKFRTMKQGAEKGIGPIRAKKNDPRVFPFGSFLRTSSLDEIPQLFNILIGDMSLVGPRPERPYFVSKLKNIIPKYMERHKVRPGLSGWAQINGRSVLTDQPAEKLKYDLYYIENWSILFDFKILFKTFFDVILRKNVF